MSLKFKNGFSLIEVSIALAISAIVLGGIITTLSTVQRVNMQYNFIQARNEIVNKIRSQSLNIINLSASADVTNTLGTPGLTPDYGVPNSIGYPDLMKKCMPDMNNSDSFGCDKTTIEEPGRGFLFYLTENAIKDPAKTVAGEDVYYRNTGMRCSSSEAANPDICPLMARVWYEPYCINFVSKCNKAISLAIRYSVGLRPDFKGELSFTDTNGEIYIPLQKGIQIRNLFSQSDSPISPNSKGIFVVQKFYGLPGQTIEGLRFETAITNPTGLISMKIQGRSITGTDAISFDDSTVPLDLLKKTWEDIPTPENPGLGAWSIDLTGATPNQTFNFGTQININNDSRPPTSFLIGKSKTDSPDPDYHWTLNADSTDYIPPAFKSGFYQFRVLAIDSSGNEIESSNYISVRLIATPEFQFINGNFSLLRDCIDSTTTYSLFIADDEKITFNQIKLNSTTVPTPIVVGNKSKLDFNFLINQNSGNYPITLTLKNQFSDVVMETMTVPKLESTQIINLSEVKVGSNITNNPEKIRLTSTGTVDLSYTAGNCCNSTPKATWSFISSPYFGGLPLLAENTTNSSANYLSNMSCLVTGNTRSCSTSITVKGIKEGPNMASPPNDISAILDLGADASNLACQFSPTKPSGDPIGKYVPVVSLPTIRFYLSESLWLHNIPPGTPTQGVLPSALKAATPRVYVRMDFAPLNDVDVYVVDSATPPNVLCGPITFPADGNPGPIDKFCNITNTNFSGKLSLSRKDNNPLTPSNKIMYAGETSCIFSPAFPCDAKFSGTVTHTICQRSFIDSAKSAINDFPMPPQFTVPADVEMKDSPYGLTTSNTQNANNDFWVWKQSRIKKLRCYDNWSKNNVASTTFNDQYNNQDYYSLYQYNTEVLTKLSPQPPPRHFKLENFTSPWPTSIVFKEFYYPVNNGVIDYGADNVPFLYMVSQSGVPEGIRWGTPSSSTTAATSSGIQYWQDVTNLLQCNGSSTLSNIKLFRIRPNINWNTPSATIKAITAVHSAFSDYNDRYSYLFMCDYGRWHPSSSTYNSWTD